MKEIWLDDDGLMGIGSDGIFQRVIPGYEGKMTEQLAIIRRKILENCLTNVDGPVTALRGRVPPVLAAALTARQSRVAERNVGQVLWNEFLCMPELGERLLTYFIKDDEGLDDYLAANKAKQIIRRVIDGFGDDSVREDASAWVFFREVPVLSTLEMFRHPLLTGIEASTRYINWGDKVDGKYMYVFPEALAGSEYESLVREVLDNLFETYGKLWPKVWDYVAHNNPRGKETSEVAWKTAVHGRVCDNLRTLVPLSAMTNGGVHANFRTLSEAIMNLRASENSETRHLADMIAVELTKINPEFVAVVDNTHGKAWTEYKRQVRQAGKRVVGNISRMHEEDEVTASVLNYDYRRDLITALILSDRPGLSRLDLAAELNQADSNFDLYLSELAGIRTNRRHKVPDFFETVSLIINFNKLTFGAAKDFNRHRKRNMQSEFDWTGNLGFDIPEDIEMIGGEVKALFGDAQEKALAAYQEIAGRYPIEARSLLTHGTFTRFTIGMGLGEAIWMTELRTIPTGNPEYRRLAQLMWNELTNLMPDMKVVGKYVDMEWYSLGRIKEAVKADLKGRG